MSQLSKTEQILSDLRYQPKQHDKKLTRAQQDLKKAIECIQKRTECSDEFKKKYITRVRGFPALIMTSGLAQALAFSVEKSNQKYDQEKKEEKLPPLAQAHQCLLEDVAAILDREVKDLVKIMQEAEVSDYMHMTRRVLRAWIYYQRFAKSILDPNDELKNKDSK